MSYIIPSTSPFVSIKLTEKGREQLAQGQLNFSYWAIGDSEINYDRELVVNSNPTDPVLSATSIVFRPVDRQPNLKSFVTKTNATTNYQTIESNNINVIKAVVNNQALERGFFNRTGTSFTTKVTNEFTPYYQVVNNSEISGTTILSLTSTTNVNIGDYLLVKMSNDTNPSISVDETTLALPNLWYKVQGKTGTTVELDRNLPDYSIFSSSSIVLTYKGGEIYNSYGNANTTAYWDSGTLSFNSNVNITCYDVPIWNMNNVWCENLAGMSANTLYEDYTKFGSYPYLGSKNPYFEYLCETSGVSNTTLTCNGPGFSYTDDVSKSISIFHYTNNTISNLYGEFLYIDATNSKYVKIHLPNIMYHRRNYNTGVGNNMGMTFIATGVTSFLGTSDVEYIELIEDPSMIASGQVPMVIGKVFPQLKMVVIHDDEIVSALSYKSNRNWTLPELSANIQAPSGGTTTGILQPNETIYLTYVLEISGLTGGLTNNLPCQKYVKVTNNSSSSKDIVFKINDVDLLPYMRKIEDISYDGFGFYATNFKLLYQIVTDTTSRPDSASWKVYDFTSAAITGVLGETINPILLENQSPLVTGFKLDESVNSASTNFDLITLLNLPPNNQPDLLQFGDERFLYGNIETYIGASIYKTIFDIRVDANQFSETSNQTRSKDLSTNPPNIKVSEVGVYDSQQNLVCIGKLSKPVELTPGKTIIFELSMDF
jgi:hypothetical protein